MLTVAMFMSACGAVVVMSSKYVVLSLVVVGCLKCRC